LWNYQKGTPLISFYGVGDRDWLAVTPDHFFAFSAGTERILSVVNGTEAFASHEYYLQYNRPELIQDLLNGDPSGEYGKAVSQTKLPRR
jgi:hypothetical protein